MNKKTQIIIGVATAAALIGGIGIAALTTGSSDETPTASPSPSASANIDPSATPSPIGNVGDGSPTRA